MKAKIIFIIFFSFGLFGFADSSRANNWYIDKDATGTGDGKSWANAVTQICTYNSSSCPYGIPVAGYGQCPNTNAVCGGDTIYISGGATSKTYTLTQDSEFLKGADLNGADNGHRLTIQTGAKDTSSGHENHGGMVIFDANNVASNIANLPVYTTLDGEKNGQINWKFMNTFKPDKWSHAIVANGDYSIIKYIELENVAGGIIMWNQRPGGEVANCYLHDVRGDYAIAIDNPDNITGYDQVLIHDNVIDINATMDSGSGPDGIQSVGGSSIYNNVFKHGRGIMLLGVAFSNGTKQPAVGDNVTVPSTGAYGKVTYVSVSSGAWSTGNAHGYMVMDYTSDIYPTWAPGGALYDNGVQIATVDPNTLVTQHSDFIQGWAYYNKVYNNTFINPMDSVYDMSGDKFSHMYFFNNLIYSDTDAPMPGQPGPTGLRFSGYAGPTIISDFHIINNTFVDKLGSHDIGISSAQAGTISNTEVKNNIMINTAKANPPFQAITMGMVGASPTDLTIDKNLINDGANGSSVIEFNRSLYTQATGWINKTSSLYTPFVSYSERSKSNNFHLRSDDTIAKGQGFNLSSQCSTIPELCQDKDGNARPASGNWDLGAFGTGGNGDATPPAAPQGLTVQ